MKHACDCYSDLGLYMSVLTNHTFCLLPFNLKYVHSSLEFKKMSWLARHPAMVAQIEDIADYKYGHLSNRACVLRNPLVYQNYLCKFNTHCTDEP